MALYVDIEKQCGDFQLKVKFEAGQEVFAILGASGCGKSMTLKCIAGIEKPDRGIIHLDEQILFDSERRINLPPQKRNVGYLFQDYALFPHMTVLQNIRCGAGKEEKAWEYLRRFLLEGKENLYPRQLSGGQKQRTALARMLAAEPEVVLLDEPLSALDSHLKAQLERELIRVTEDFEGTVLFVSHNRDEVYHLTDRIAVMEEGYLTGIQTKKELFQSPQTLAATRLTGCENVTRVEPCGNGELRALDWGIVLQKKGVNPAVCHYAGIHAHDFQIVQEMEPVNVLEGQIIKVLEEPFFQVILFRHRGCKIESEDSVLTVRLPKEQWEKVTGERIFMKIPENQLIVMER